jgi:hypothetical protein
MMPSQASGVLKLMLPAGHADIGGMERGTGEQQRARDEGVTQKAHCLVSPQDAV